MLKLNLGCGFHTPSGWLNVDYAIGAWLAKTPGFATINKKFKIINLNWSNDIFLCDLTKKLPLNLSVLKEKKYLLMPVSKQILSS